MKTARQSKPVRKGRTALWAMLAALMATFSAGVSASVEIAPSPLFLGSNVPGNLILTPSVEWPTINSVANLGPYSSAASYTGYFDPNKCYLYVWDAVEANRYFNPTRVSAAGHDCSGAKEWSGNFMNWVATQTIDPFRKALTGGLRTRDTVTETFIEKARHDGQGGTSVYPDRTLGGGLPQATAANAGTSSMEFRINDLGNKMYFTRVGFGSANDVDAPAGGTITAYNPALIGSGNSNPEHLANDGKMPNPGNPSSSRVADTRMYEVSVRVKVCVPGLLESNCVQYGANYKPEGLIQQYQDRIKYSIFGYLNDHDGLRDGAALRANQKFVGPLTYHPTLGQAANPAKEWDPTTGILVQNPDTADATSTTSAVGQTISNSGVINYLNKFGQMTSKDHKNYDPVSEMYYAAVRYLKKQGNISSYTNFNGANSAANYELADGFPVITAWNDPIAFRCQANVILGIGDANTWDDKNLPGSPYTGTEPAKPAQVTADTTVDVLAATQNVSRRQGINPPFSNNPFTGRNNSAFIAGLAFDAHTVDLRPPGANELVGVQTASTHWVDVREAQVLEPSSRNQYYLAAKFGGFRVPAGFQPYANTAALPQSLWHAGAATDLTSNGEVRPDNFYEASNANQMVASLTTAFARIVSEIRGTGASFGASSTRLQNGTTLYQSSYFSSTWKGDMTSYPLDLAGNVGAATWSAGDQLLAADWTARKIYMESGAGILPFRWANLTAAQQAILGNQMTVDYLRGERTNEAPNVNNLRPRTGVLGDIVDSQPVFVGPPNANLYRGSSFTGASAYAAFATAQASRDSVIYVGANDGMLHAFNADDGQERFAYVPKAAINADLKAYTTPTYDHRYTVDGELTVASVYIGSAWKTVLVGTTGRGGTPGVFALDVTDPDNVVKLWDKSVTDIPALGNNLGKPIIAQVADGDWRVMFGNGLNSSAGTAQLITIRLSTGVAANVDLGGSPDNGLAAPAIWNSDGDQFFDRAYAGDYKGNLWRIDGLSLVAPTKTKIFVATDGTPKTQPITSAPLVATRPASTETWLFFGTGSYLNDADLTNKDVQTWYGLKDSSVATLLLRTNLVQRTVTAQAAKAGQDIARAISAGTDAELVGKSGWYLDLKPPSGPVEGERMVVPNVFRGLNLVGITRIPEGADACAPGGSGYVYEIQPFTGGSLPSASFDTNGDGQVTAADTVGATTSPASAIRLDTGGNGVIVVGNRMYATLDDGSRFTPVPPPDAQTVQRVNWREVIGD